MKNTNQVDPNVLFIFPVHVNHRQTSNTSRALVSNKIVDHCIFILNFTSGFNKLGNEMARRDKKHLSRGIKCDSY